MSEAVLWIGVALALALVVNLVPAFMPSTWMILAFFYITFDLPLLPLTIGGAVVSGFGRFLLAKGSDLIARRFMPGKQADLQELGLFLESRGHWLSPAVFLYALTPLPTNNLFVAAGMVRVNLAWVLAGFWTSRIIADTFWVWTASQAFGDFDEIMSRALGNPLALAIQLAGVASIVLLYVLPWARWLNRLTRRPAAPVTDGRSASH